MSASGLARQEYDFNLQRRRAWFVIGIYIVVIAVPILAGGARLLVPLFPLSSLAVGVYLYRNAPEMYVSYTFWMVFLAPCVRRLIDYKSGAVTFGPWTLSSLLVALVSMNTFVKTFPRLIKQGDLPFLMCFGSMIYGLLISLVQNSIRASVLGALGWFAPLGFGYHLYTQWQSYPAFRQIIRKTFLWGALLMGAYGVVQYLVVPAWDGFWIEQISELGTLSFGNPEPLEIRVSSTMNSPQAFGSVMMAGLILLMGESQSALYFPATGFGYLSFLLSMARAAWLSWVVAMPMLLLSLRPKLQMRLFITVVVTALLLVPVISMEQFSDAINDRISSFSDTENDTSFNDRFSGYSELLGLALSTVIGGGYSFSVDTQTSLTLGDGAILPMLFGFGWLGTLPYLGGVLLLMAQLFRGRATRSDSLNSAARSVTLGLLAQIALNHMLVDAIGITFWGFLGMGLAGDRFYSHVTSRALNQVRNQHLKPNAE